MGHIGPTIFKNSEFHAPMIQCSTCFFLGGWKSRIPYGSFSAFSGHGCCCDGKNEKTRSPVKLQLGLLVQTKPIFHQWICLWKNDPFETGKKCAISLLKPRQASAAWLHGSKAPTKINLRNAVNGVEMCYSFTNKHIHARNV